MENKVINELKNLKNKVLRCETNKKWEIENSKYENKLNEYIEIMKKNQKWETLMKLNNNNIEIVKLRIWQSL